MSDVMLFGVLRMPYELAMSSELSRRQFYDRAQEAADEIERLRARLAEPERAVALPSLPDARGYMTVTGLRAMERDESTCLVRKHPYLIDDPQGMYTADQMRDYAIAALRAAGVEVKP